MKSFKHLKLPLKTTLWVLVAVFVLATIYTNYQIISDNRVGSPETSVKDGLKINKEAYKNIIGDNEKTTALSQNGNIGRIDPFAPLP